MSIKHSRAAALAIMQAVAMSAAAIASTSAMATFITLETRDTDRGVNSADLVSSWNTQTSNIEILALEEFDRTTAPGSNRHSRLRIGFEASGLENLRFQLAPDAGFGAALYVNSMLVGSSTQSLWWGYNWNRPFHIMDTFGTQFALGPNVIDLYWAENCCNGGQSGRFSTNGGQDWMTLSVENLDSMAVPEPGTLALLGTGAFGIALAWRRRRFANDGDPMPG